MTTHHVLDASPETVHWGYFDAVLPPRMSVASGDTVTATASPAAASRSPT